MATPSIKATANSVGDSPIGQATIAERSASAVEPGGHFYGPSLASTMASADEQRRGQERDERSLSDVRKHNHDGANSEQINFSSLAGIVPTVSVIPSVSTNSIRPKTVSDQLRIYISGPTMRLYIYDALNDAWRYVALT